MNVGWLQGYTGNYGNAVQCPGQAALPPAVDVSLTTQLEDKIKKLEAQLLSCQAANNVSAIERAVIPMLKGQNKRLSSR